MKNRCVLQNPRGIGKMPGSTAGETPAATNTFASAGIFVKLIVCLIEKIQVV
jgi:hypothetical protein